MQRIKRVNVSLRPVTRKDWTFILQIRNEPDVRLACHDTSVISFDAHTNYMAKLETDPDVHQWIICSEGENVGHVKIVHGELGYMLKNGYRGKGLGTKFHELVFIEARKLGIKKLKDTIKLDNRASLNLAVKTGFMNLGIIFKGSKPYAHVLEKRL
jgi:RimJ/RimL family protein N-acetyltransferase